MMLLLTTEARLKELNLLSDGTSTGTPDTASQINGYTVNAEATSAQYDSIETGTSNNNRWETVEPKAENNNACLWVQFDILEKPANITKIECKYEGFQNDSTDKGWFAIWNWHYSLWHVLEASQQTSDYDYEGEITTNPSHFVSSNGNLILIFFNEDAGEKIFCDYIEVDITYDAVAGISKKDYGLGMNTNTAYGTINGNTISASMSSGWNHIALTYANAKGTMKLYVNGVSSASQTLTGAIRANANKLIIGDSTAFTGLIDEVRIVDYVRTGFNAGIVINEVCYWPSSGYEWIELYNDGGSAIDCDGWKFVDSESNTYTVPSGANYILSPGEYVTIWLCDVSDSTDRTSDWFTINGTTHSLGTGDLGGDNNTGGDRIYMYPNATTGYKNLTDFIGWGSGGGNDTEAEAAGIWDMDATNPYIVDDGENYEYGGNQMYAGCTIGLSSNGKNDAGKIRHIAFQATGTQGNSNGGASPLAVELISFEAITGYKEVILCWQTEVEIDNKKWLITRNTEEIDAEIIATIPTKGINGQYAYLDSLVEGGITYWYLLGDISTQGDTTWHKELLTSATPNIYKIVDFTLHQNYPNPFLEYTTIRYSVPGKLPGPSKSVRLSIYNVSGRIVHTLVNCEKAPGNYLVKWDGKSAQQLSLPSGVYFYNLKVGTQEITNKLFFFH